MQTFLYHYEKKYKEKNSDIQQFHQYHQNEQSYLAFTHCTQKTMTCDAGNPVPGLEQAQQCGRAKSFNRITILPSLQLVLQWQYIYKQTIKKPAHIRFHYKRQHIITRMNENKV